MSNTPTPSSKSSNPVLLKSVSAATDAADLIGLDLLSTIYDPGGYATSVTALDLRNTKGSVVLGSNGVATYTPGSAYTYLAVGTKATDTFGYTVSDGHGGSVAATATVTIVGTWRPPVANADVASTKAGQAVTLNPLANDTDPQTGQTLHVTALNMAGAQGTAVINANGTVTYTPGARASTMTAGAVATDKFGYTVSDGHGSVSTSTVTVTITGVNQAPVARPDTATTLAGQGVWLGLTNNDTDPNGDALSVAGLNTAGTKGTVSLNPAATNGAYYTTGTSFAWLAPGATATDTFTYTVSDGHGGTATATATVTVIGINSTPVAKADTASTASGQSVWLGLANNDTDPNGFALSVASLNTTGTKGTVSLNPAAPNGAYYNPGTAFASLSVGETATDKFSYTVSNGHGGTATATATVTVNGVNKAPVAANQSATTDASHAVTLNVLAGVTDINADDKETVTSLNLTGTNGSATINSNGTVTYTPGSAYAKLAPGSSTIDRFGYTVSDGHGGTANATATVTITAPSIASAATVTTVPTPAIYVATNGNDSWSGKLSAPNAAGTDGPLATLRAAQAVMENSSTIKTVYIEGGTYNLTSTLILDASDSGQSWLAMPGQTPVINGGQAVTGWVQGSNGMWTATAPANAFAAGGANVDLFVQGTRETHARYPNAVPTNPVQGGWLTAAASLPGEHTTSSFQFNPGDVPSFASTSGLYVAVYEQTGWQSYSLPVASIDYSTHTINLAGSTEMPIDAGSRYYIYNAASQLDAPGEWFYNPATNKITLDAPAGFNGSGVTLGSLQNIITVSGAHNVTLAGLTIAGSTSTGTGVNITRSTGVSLAGDTITNVGTGINIDTSGGNDVIQGSLIQNTNDNGINIAPGPNNITIEGNTIQNIGQLTNGSGIWFTGSSNDIIAHNTIMNTADLGIGGGSVFGKSDASYNDTITSNVLVNTNQATSDGGAIYITGMQQDSTGDSITNNTISGTSAAGTAHTAQQSFLSPSQLFSFGIYLDDFASGVTVKGNTLYNNEGGIDIHSGWNNQIVDNTLVNSSVAALSDQVVNWRGAGAQASTGNVFSGNLVANSQSGAVLARNEGAANAATWTGNFYATAGLGNAAFISQTSTGADKSQSFGSWQAAGFDTGSKTGTPSFLPDGYNLSSSLGAFGAAAGGGTTSLAGTAGFVAANPYDLYGTHTGH